MEREDGKKGKCKKKKGSRREGKEGGKKHINMGKKEEIKKGEIEEEKKREGVVKEEGREESTNMDGKVKRRKMKK
jgi:hypothetical protein